MNTKSFNIVVMSEFGNVFVECFVVTRSIEITACDLFVTGLSSIGGALGNIELNRTIFKGYVEQYIVLKDLWDRSKGCGELYQLELGMYCRDYTGTLEGYCIECCSPSMYIADDDDCVVEIYDSVNYIVMCVLLLSGYVIKIPSLLVIPMLGHSGSSMVNKYVEHTSQGVPFTRFDEAVMAQLATLDAVSTGYKDYYGSISEIPFKQVATNLNYLLCGEIEQLVLNSMYGVYLKYGYIENATESVLTYVIRSFFEDKSERCIGFSHVKHLGLVGLDVDNLRLFLCPTLSDRSTPILDVFLISKDTIICKLHFEAGKPVELLRYINYSYTYELKLLEKYYIVDSPTSVMMMGLSDGTFEDLRSYYTLAAPDCEYFSLGDDWIAKGNLS